MTDDFQAVMPVEERIVEFYGDELVAVMVTTGEQLAIYVPLKPIADNMGLDWSAQYRRVQRDPILSEESQLIAVTAIKSVRGNPEALCLPLKFIPGWLFGVNANRVREDLRDKVIRYQRECYDVLAEAFQEGRLVADESFELLLQRADPEIVRAYEVAQAVVRLARNQILLEARLEGRLDEHERRLEDLEATLGDTGHHISPAQAMSISQAVKAIALELGKKSRRNEFGGVYGEFYRRFGIPGYRELPARRFDEAMDFLREWYLTVADTKAPPF